MPKKSCLPDLQRYPVMWVAALAQHYVPAGPRHSLIENDVHKDVEMEQAVAKLFAVCALELELWIPEYG